MIILGIETSCDETAAAIVRDGREILSNVVVSQIDIFAEYGGVIPEVAARSHLEVMMPVVDKALSDAGVSWDEIDAIGVTYAPGLLGSLLVGTLTARALAILHNKPLYAVHHLKSHVYANWLIQERENCSSPSSGALPAARPCLTPSDRLEPIFPLLALVVSGGHTQILYMPGHNQFEIIGTTRDDAVGECFDKVAKILGLPYPGGPAIAKTALKGDPNKYRLPHPKLAGLDFSFSGLKTAVLRAVQKEVGVPISYPSHKLKELLNEQQVADFAASFQKTAVEILLEKLSIALEQYPEVNSVVFAGGVSANKTLRAMINTESENTPLRNAPSGPSSRASVAPYFPRREICSSEEYSSDSDTHTVSYFFPAPSLSGDNGAMVAAACFYEIQSGVEPVNPYALNIYPRISVEED